MLEIVHKNLELVNSIDMRQKCSQICSEKPCRPGCVNHPVFVCVLAEHQICLQQNCDMAGVQHEQPLLSLYFIVRSNDVAEQTENGEPSLKTGRIYLFSIVAEVPSAPKQEVYVEYGQNNSKEYVFIERNFPITFLAPVLHDIGSDDTADHMLMKKLCQSCHIRKLSGQ